MCRTRWTHFSARANPFSPSSLFQACSPRYVWFSYSLKRREPIGTCFTADEQFNNVRKFSPCQTSEQNLQQQAFPETKVIARELYPERGKGQTETYSTFFRAIPVLLLPVSPKIKENLRQQIKQYPILTILVPLVPFYEPFIPTLFDNRCPILPSYETKKMFFTSSDWRWRVLLRKEVAWHDATFFWRSSRNFFETRYTRRFFIYLQKIDMKNASWQP